MRAALRYPLAGDAEDRYLVAWILHLVHALVVPVVPLAGLMGLLGGVTRAAAAGEDPPGFRDLRRTGRDAVVASGVAVVYLLPGVGVLAVAALLVPTGAPSDLPATPVALLAAGILGLLLPLAYAAPASLAHATSADSLAAGFDRGRVGATLGDGRYFVQWSAGVVALAGAVVSVAALGGVLVGYLLAAYCEVLAFACFGWGASATVTTGGD
jgi:hypothetical protein